MTVHPVAFFLVAVLAGCGLPRIPAHPLINGLNSTLGPSQMEVCWIESARTTAPGLFGSAGWNQSPVWDVTTSAVLVRHPQGTVLIDTGMPPDAEAEARELPWWPRFVFRQTAGRNRLIATVDQRLTPDDRSRLRGMILSHVHPDHAGGVEVLPNVPAWVGPAEPAFVAQAMRSRSPAVLPRMGNELIRRMQPIAFTSGPYENFDESWDVFGDGTVVVVPTPGHTPGSVSTFVNLGDRRFLHVGDTVGLHESIERGVPKSAVMRAFTDEDGEKTQTQVARLLQLQQLEPALWILPAHDRRAWIAIFGGEPEASKPPLCVHHRAAAGAGPR